MGIVYFFCRGRGGVGSYPENKLFHMIPVEYDQKVLTGWKGTKRVSSVCSYTAVFLYDS